MEDYLICPNCGNEMPLIDCEKTTHCNNCDIEWKYDDDFELVIVKPGDDIYLDR